MWVFIFGFMFGYFSPNIYRFGKRQVRKMLDKPNKRKMLHD